MTDFPEQDEARIADLITASRILANEGILDSFGHVTVRSAVNPERFYIPRAMPPALVTRDDIFQLDMDCIPTDPDCPRLNGERFIHSGVYKVRPEIQSVIHTHDLAVIPFSIAGKPLQPVVAQAGFLPPETPLFEIRDANRDMDEKGMLVRTPELAAALAKCLGDAPAVLMRGHGNTVVGRSAKEACVRAVYVNINARAQFMGMQLGPVTPMNENELTLNAKENFDADRPWAYLQSRMKG